MRVSEFNHLGGWGAVVFRLMEIRGSSGRWRSALAGLVLRSVLDRRGVTETSRWQLKEDGKEKE